MTTLGSASAALFLVALVACYDFTLPEEGSGGAGSAAGPTTSSAAGGAGGTIGSGAAPPTGVGGAGMYPPPCDQWSCGQCAICVADFFAGDVAACQDYDACIDGCMGSMTCEAGCKGSYPNGLFLRETLQAECEGVCGGPVSCGG